jgi:hypothetical protein
MTEKAVTLNVYDLPGAEDGNAALNPFGLGFYHSGVEIGEYEYSFTNFGIQRTRPRVPEFGRLREQIVMGTIILSVQEINVVVNRLGANGFQGSSYHIVNCNCNAFSERFCQELVGQSIPLWVNRAASIGQSFTTQTPPFPAPATANSSSSSASASASASAQAGAASSASDATSTAPQAPKSESVFSWLLGGWGGSTDTAKASTAPAPVAPADPGRKKELTEQQKALLANLKKK